MPDSPESPSGTDPTVRALAALFRGHPAWVRAARHLSGRAESAVFFTHLPGRTWRLVRRRGETLLLDGRAHDPDFAFRFSAAAVDRLEALATDDIGDFAVVLFECIVDPDESKAIGLRIVAPFTRLVRRGYVRLLLAAGPKLIAFGATRGVHTLGELRRFVARMRRRRPAEWERPANQR